MIRQLLCCVVVLFLLGFLPGVALAKQSGSRPSSAPAVPPINQPNPPKTGEQEGDSAVEPRNPAPGYVIAVLALGLVLTIVCMPSRKG